MNTLVRVSALACLLTFYVPSKIEQQASNRDEVIAAMRPYDGPTVKGVDASTLTGKVLCGYQGWFATSGDGSDRGWRHYASRGQFKPGSCSIDLWPDMSEMDEDEKYRRRFVTRMGVSPPCSVPTTPRPYCGTSAGWSNTGSTAYSSSASPPRRSSPKTSATAIPSWPTAAKGPTAPAAAMP
jgi:hypothetical protein